MMKIKKVQNILVLTVSLFIGFHLNVFAFHVNEFHPRLISLSQLQIFLQDKNKRKIINELRKEANFELSTPPNELFTNRNRYYTYVKLYSFMYLVDNVDGYYKKAKNCITYILKIPIKNDDYNVLAQLEALTYYYDFCFDAIDVQEKARIREEIVKRIKWLKKHGLFIVKNFGGSHAHYANRIIMFAALAIYDEYEEGDVMVAQALHNMQEGFLPFYKYLAEEDGGFHMWWEYSRYYLKGVCEFFDVWRNATGEDLFKENLWLSNTFYFMLYGMRDMTNWGTGDNHARHVGWVEEILFQKLAAEYHNGHARYMAEQIDKKPRDWPGIDELFFDLLWKDDSVEPESIKNLPLVKEFKRVGAYVFREGWKGDNICALFKCTPTYFFNHSHRDANSFEIWYKSDLAIDSGYYDAYGSTHWFNYYIRTIAHNTVLIFDPNEKIANWDKIKSNDGGQRFSQSNHEQPYNVKDLQDKAFNIAESSLIENNDDYALAMGDATRAYSPHKCELFQRYFLFLKKVKNWKHPIIVIFDKVVSTKPEFEKIWLLHSINKPKIKNNIIDIVNGEGKLWCYVIQPEEATIDIVGGEGQEFVVDGINYEPDTKKAKAVKKWAGSWRIELKEKIPHKETHFLTVLIPTEKSMLTAPKIEKIARGVRIENWKIIFEDNILKVMNEI